MNAQWPQNLGYTLKAAWSCHAVNLMLVAVNKELKHTAKTEWHTTSKHGMDQSDLSPNSRIPGALGIIKDFSCQPALKLSVVLYLLQNWKYYEFLLLLEVCRPGDRSVDSRHCIEHSSSLKTAFLHLKYMVIISQSYLFGSFELKVLDWNRSFYIDAWIN